MNISRFTYLCLGALAACSTGASSPEDRPDDVAAGATSTPMPTAATPTAPEPEVEPVRAERLLFQPSDAMTSADATQPMIGIAGHVAAAELDELAGAVRLEHLRGGAPVRFAVRHEAPDAVVGETVHWIVLETDAALARGWYRLAVDPAALSPELADAVVAGGALDARFHVGALPTVQQVSTSTDGTGVVFVRVEFSERMLQDRPLHAQLAVRAAGTLLTCAPASPDDAAEPSVRVATLRCAGYVDGDDLTVEFADGVRNVAGVPLADITGQALGVLDLGAVHAGSEGQRQPAADALTVMADALAPQAN